MNAKPLALLLVVAILLVPAYPQTQSAQQDIPDAPQPNKPASAFPANTAPAPKSGDRPLPPPEEQPLPPPPTERAKTMPSSNRPASADSNSRNELPTFHKSVDFVVVPVTVKDSDGRLVEGLLKKDFTVFEDGEPEKISFFDSEPFPLSVAVVLDSNMSEQTMRKVRETLPSLAGAFSDFDEVGVFSYGNTVNARMDFSGAGGELETALRHSQLDANGNYISGRPNGPPVVSGPMTGTASPSVNGHPFDPSVPHVTNYRQESSVLNDAILAAATALSKRDRARRKLIFVISDGLEKGSNASYGDVLKVLLSNEIAVYAIGVDSAAIPGYNTLQNIRIPRMGSGNILPKYVSATGGDVFAEFTKDAIEQAYARLTEEARNQYTLGYTTRATAANNYRSIDVRVHRPALIVRAKDGYYPLPPERQQ